VTNYRSKNAIAADDYLKASGAGSDVDPHIIEHAATLLAGTAGIGKLTANSGVDIGDVDVTSIAAGDNNIGNVDIASIAAGDNNIGNVDIVSGTITAVTAITNALPAGTNNIGDVDIVSGTITTVSTVTSVTAIANALPAGTNNIGDVDVLTIAAGDNNIGNVDIVSLPALAAGTNAVGKLLPPDVDVTAHTNYAKKYYTSAGAATDGIIWSPAAGKRWHITTITIQVSAAATVTLEDDKAGGDEAIYKAEFAANGGIVLTFPEMYPWASGEDAADLIITTSAGNVYVTCVGYEV
jgi:hypothetical protein